MRRASHRVTLAYHARAIGRTLLSWWFSRSAPLYEWWDAMIAKYWITEDPTDRLPVSYYPRFASCPDGRLEWHVSASYTVPTDPQLQEIMQDKARRDCLECYLKLMERCLPPLPRVHGGKIW